MMVSGCSTWAPSNSIDLPPLPRSARDARATVWFKSPPNAAEFQSKLLEVRRNELRLARALTAVNREWYPQVQRLYYGKGAK